MGLSDNFYFYRDSNQNEVDMIIDDIMSLDAVEIKSSETFSTHFLNGLNHVKKVLPEKIRKTFLCYAGQQEMQYLNHQLINFRNISGKLNSQ